MIAHLRKTDGEAQQLLQHCRAVSELCARIARWLGLEQTARLIGLLHDMGKATEEIQAGLYRAWREAMARLPHHHAPAGAIYVCRRWFFPEGRTKMQRLTAQIVALCIHGHHAGLADCLDENGTSPWLTAMERQEDEEILAQAGQWFFTHVVSEEELGELFEQATAEIEAFYQKIWTTPGSRRTGYARLGLLTRLLLSILVDADRWDSACFEYRADPFAAPENVPNWTELLARFETFRKANLNGVGEIDRVRTAVSDECFQNADASPGVVTLCVPTGGGKTFSSLRYALRHAEKNGQQRIFYIIPYKHHSRPECKGHSPGAGGRSVHSGASFECCSAGNGGRRGKRAGAGTVSPVDGALGQRHCFDQPGAVPQRLLWRFQYRCAPFFPPDERRADLR